MMNLRPSYTRLPVTPRALHYFSSWTIHWCNSRDFLSRLASNVKIDRTVSVETIRAESMLTSERKIKSAESSIRIYHRGLAFYFLPSASRVFVSPLIFLQSVYGIFKRN